MRAILVLMSLVNVGLAAVSGYFAAMMPAMFDTGSAGTAAAPISFVLVAGFPLFCLVAAAWPHLLLSLGRAGAARFVAVAPALIMAGIYGWISLQGTGRRRGLTKLHVGLEKQLATLRVNAGPPASRSMPYQAGSGIDPP